MKLKMVNKTKQIGRMGRGTLECVSQSKESTHSMTRSGTGGLLQGLVNGAGFGMRGDLRHLV